MEMNLITISSEELAGLTTYYTHGNRISHGKTENLLLHGKVGPTHCRAGYHLSDGGVVCFYKNRSKEDAVYVANSKALETFRTNLTDWARLRKTKLPPQFNDFDSRIGGKQIKPVSPLELEQIMRHFVLYFGEKEKNEILMCLNQKND